MLKLIDEYPPIESLKGTPYFILGQYARSDSSGGLWFATVVTEDGRVGIYRLPVGTAAQGSSILIRTVGKLRFMIIP